MPRLPRLDGLRILVVDDNADGRALTSLVLTQAGASVKAVASVREALQLLEVERPDALVSDIGLPDEDGYGLIRQIRQYEAEHGGFLPAVALTGYARAEDRARILAAGFQAHVPKPVEPVELTAAIATITHHLRDSALQRERSLTGDQPRSIPRLRDENRSGARSRAVSPPLNLRVGPRFPSPALSPLQSRTRQGLARGPTSGLSKKS